MTRFGRILRRRWVAAVAIATLMSACGGLPSTLPIPRPTADSGGQQVAGAPPIMLATMQRLFTLLNTTQRDGETVLTTKITKSATTDGHRNTPRDYAMGKVSPAQATLEFSWHFTDLLTSTDASGTIRLEHLTISPDPAINKAVMVGFAYAASSDLSQGISRQEGGNSSPQDTRERYLSGADGTITPLMEESTGPIHIPVVPLTRAIRAAMTVQQDLSVTLASSRSFRLSQVKAVDLTCKLSRSSQLQTDENVIIWQASAPAVEWSADDSRTGIAYRGPGTYSNQDIVMPDGNVQGTVVVNPDERSGTMTGSRPAPISGVDAVSGRFPCPPRSVGMVAEAYS